MKNYPLARFKAVEQLKCLTLSQLRQPGMEEFKRFEGSVQLICESF